MDRQLEAYLYEASELEEEVTLADGWPSGDLLDREINQFVMSVLQLVAARIPVAEMDAKASAAETYDIEPLRALVEPLRKSGVGTRTAIIGDKELDGKAILKDFEVAVANFDGAQAKFGRLEATLRISWAFNSYLTRLFVVAAANNLDVSALVAHVRQGLDTATPEQLHQMWSGLLGETSPGAPAHIPRTLSMFPADFFKAPGTLDEMRARLARYVVELRPQAMVHLVGAGQDETLSIVAGAASMLANEPTGELVLRERRLLEALSAVAELSGRYPDILAALGLDGAPWIIRSIEHRKVGSTTTVTASRIDPRRHVLRRLRRLLRLVDAYTTWQTPIERALLQYKLGLEVTLPESRPQERPAELRLQKEICKFLLERGIRTVGTKFGPAETDLLATMDGEVFIVETKICDKSVTARNIKHSLTQLQTYMGQQELATRGILLLYNMTEKPILAPRIWLRSSYWVLPVNLPSCGSHVIVNADFT